MDKLASSKTISSSVLAKTVKSARQKIAILPDNDQGLLFKAILDTSGSIVIDAIAEKANAQAQKPITPEPALSSQVNFDDSEFLALLLDPDDLNALIEANIENQTKAEYLTSSDKTILKLEDVLHQDDSLDELLPADQDEQWYLLGSSDAINKAIASPAMQDIQDALLMQQLKLENYVE